MRSVLVAAVAVLLAFGAVAAGIAVIQRHSDPVYLVDLSDVVVAVTAAVVALVGLAGMLLAERRDLALLAALTTALFMAGIATAFSIGFLLFLIASIPLSLLVRRINQGVNWPALLSGVAMAASLMVLAYLVAQSPLVACNADGASISVDGDSVSGTAHGGDGFETGSVEFDGNRFDYECRQGELVRFELFVGNGAKNTS